MKYCEKCGNEIKEGFQFCDKCGTKVENKKEKKKDKKEEKKKEVITEPVIEEPVRPIIDSPKKKSGKGKTFLLTLLFLILLASTITFLILWLTKPCKKCDNTNSSSNNDPKPTEKNDYVGKWEQNVEYKSGSTVMKRTYGMINLKEDGTFESIFYDKSDITGTKEEIDGTYTIKNKKVTLKYNGSSVVKVFKDDKLCLDDDCENYLVMNSYNNKVVLTYDGPASSDIDYITYSQYENLQKDYKDAIVVIVREGCSWCQKFESVVEEINDNYSTPVYYYNSDGKISISGTPTTIIIKNGYPVDTVVGYKDYDDMVEILDDLGVK